MGERKVRALLRAGALVHVISPALTPRLALLATQKKIELTRRCYRPADLLERVSARKTGASRPRLTLVFAATNSPETQKAVRLDAERLGAMVNVADDAQDSDFIVPASFAQGDLLVAISTSGSSPALARQLRRRLQRSLGSEYRAHLRFLRETRKHVMATVPDKEQRAKILQKLAEAPAADWLPKDQPRAVLKAKKL